MTKEGHAPNWNFCKYLVGKDGKVIAFFPSKVTPESKELRDAIDHGLGRLVASGELRRIYEKYGVWTDAQTELNTMTGPLEFVSGRKNAAGWSLALRPVANSTDSPDDVEGINSLLLDGASSAKAKNYVGGPK